ncbi:Transposase DDE domain-containing protein [Neorhodopirellula lusitana]|uniref:Transposase DDE domain-containing protein n=2 Tax=Neorhodopirellula lusitana TaxID=445327 RepID=A0ABY1QTW1_9BACT|nr:transposase [Neorhodopirellula lusitana]SMP80365.1 Transposase DDE domain-containing protein [Neorhodopirellula lusitana]
MQATRETIATLNLDDLHQAYRGTGSAPYRPELMLGIALVELLRGDTSPARWHQDADTREQCRLLGQGISPSRTAWYDFRDRSLKFIEQVHQSMVDKAIKQRLIEPEECALYGTFTAAAASRHKIYNLKQINRRLNRLGRTIRQLDRPDQAASKKPLEAVPKWIAPTPGGRAEQLDRFSQAKRRMLENIDENRKKHCRYRRDEARMVISPADVDAVIGRDKHKVLRPLYNTQLMTDCSSDLIVAFGVWAQAGDHATLAPMIEKTQRITGDRLRTVHADSGYCSILDLKDCEALNINLYAPVQDNTNQPGRKSRSGASQIPSCDFAFDESTRELTCPGGHAMKLVREVQAPRADGRRVGELRYEQSVDHCGVCPLADRCLGVNAKRRTISRQSDQAMLEAQKRKMDSPAGKRSGRLRGQVVERRFGDGKKHRGQDAQNGRGLARVQAEVGLLVVAQNTLTLWLLVNRTKTKPI